MLGRYPGESAPTKLQLGSGTDTLSQVLSGRTMPEVRGNPLSIQVDPYRQQLRSQQPNHGRVRPA